MHIPVMLYEVIKYLDINSNGVYFDCTFGQGGHSFEILRYLSNSGMLVALDKDSSVFKLNDRNFIDKIRYNNCSFNEITKVATDLNLLGKIDGIFVDLGISTNQLLDKTRGFGFACDGFFDMRLDIYQNIRAIDWINFANIDELFSVLCFLDNKSLSRSIVKEIILHRKKHKIQTVDDFYKIVSRVCFSNNVVGKSFNKIFQSIRIFINNDLYSLFNFLDKAFLALKHHGILLLISFNSIEDKIIKNFFIDKKLKVKSLTSFVKPSVNELDINYSSKSAIMRVFIKE